MQKSFFLFMFTVRTFVQLSPHLILLLLFVFVVGVVASIIELHSFYQSNFFFRRCQKIFFSLLFLLFHFDRSSLKFPSVFICFSLVHELLFVDGVDFCLFSAINEKSRYVSPVLCKCLEVCRSECVRIFFYYLWIFLCPFSYSRSH